MKNKDDLPIPPLWQRIKNVIGASKDIVAHLVETGEVLADNELQEERMLTCSGCEYLRSDMICSSCGCNMKIKWKLDAYMCPHKKWKK